MSVSVILSFFIFVFSATFFTSTSSAQTQESFFKLSLATDPTQLDPQLQKNPNSSFLLQQLHRGLFRYDNNKGLIPDLAKECKRKSLKLICEISNNAKWNDGSAIESKHFLNTLLFLLDPVNKAVKADLIFSIKNAKNIYLGKESSKNLGFKVKSPVKFEIEFERNDFDFEYKTTSIILSPRFDVDPAKNKNKFSGPYVLSKTLPGQWLELTSNPNYLRGRDTRPPLRFYIIEEDSVALKLYQNKELDFLRRLPTLFIPQYIKAKDFHWIPLERMDYFGFGASILNKPLLRQELTQSLNYPELQKLFHSEGLPGCVGISKELYSQSPEFNGCHIFQINSPSKSKIAASKSEVNSVYELRYSALGGDDHKRATDWIQSQWKKNLNINIKTKAVENKVFADSLLQNTPDIYRKGVPLERPTCLAALEVFEDVAENESPLKIKDKDFNSILNEIRNNSSSEKLKKLCTQGLSYLMKNAYLIPTGPMHFSILANPQYEGWSYNRINQLDLAELKMTVSN